MKKLFLVLLLAGAARGMHTGVMQIPIGAEDVTLQVKMYAPGDDGTLEPGLTVTDFDLYYIRVEKDNDVTISSKADMTALNALTDAHTDNKALEIGQGYYRIDVPNAAFAAGAVRGSIIVSDDGAAALTVTVDFELVGNIHEWYVAKSGLDAHGGHSFEDAKLTIQAAIDAVPTDEGDTIIIHPGTYTENVTLDESITLKGVHRDKVRIESSTGDALTISANNCTIRSLTAKTTHTSSQAIVNSGSASGLKFFDVAGDGIMDGLLLTNSDETWLEDCYFTSPYDGMRLAGGDNVTALRCVGKTTGDKVTTGENAIIISGENVQLLYCKAYATSSTSDHVIRGIRCNAIRGSIIGCSVFVNNTASNGSEESIGIQATSLSKVLVKDCDIKVGGKAGTVRIVENELNSEVFLDGGKASFIFTEGTIQYGNPTAQVGGSEKTQFIDDDTTIGAMVDGFWDDYYIYWLLGNNAGVFSQVDVWETTPNRVTLKVATTYDIEVGDAYVIFQYKATTVQSLYEDGDSVTRVVDISCDLVNTSGTVLQGGSGWAAAVNAEADTALTDYDGPTETEMTNAITKSTAHTR